MDFNDLQYSDLEVFMLEHFTFIRVFKYTIALDCKKKEIVGLILGLRGMSELSTLTLHALLKRMFIRKKKVPFQQDQNSVHNCESVHYTFRIPLKINKSGNSITMFTGIEDVYQSVLVSTELFHKLYIQD